jgi:hypothetical protein
MTSILLDHEIGGIEKIISLTFQSYVEHANKRSYVC